MRENLSGRPSRRSDQIRHRMQKTSPTSKVTKGSRSVKTVTRTPPPVMVRNSVGSLAIGQSKLTQRNRRAVYVPLRSPGAELRLPSLPNVKIGWRIVSFFIIFILGFSIYGLWTSPIFRVDIAHVQGLENITSREVNEVLGLAGRPIFMLDAQALERQLQDSFAEFSNVNVRVDFPNKVQIRVSERVPVLMWRQDEFSLFVDQEGMAFPIRSTNTNSEIFPIVESNQAQTFLAPQNNQADPAEHISFQSPHSEFEGSQLSLDKAEQFITPEMVSTILLISKHLPEDATIIYDDSRGFSWRDKRGWDVYLGDIAEMGLKLHVYQAILQHLKSNNTKPEFISVESVHTPYYRLEQ